MPMIRSSLVLVAMFLLSPIFAEAQEGDKSPEGGRGEPEERERDGDRPAGERGPRDGDRPAGERGPRDGDRPAGERGPRDGDRPAGERGPRDGDRPAGERGPRDGGDRRPQPMGPIMALLDSNHNGVLESEEIDQAIVMLRRMDRNGDGRLTGEEFAQRREGDRPPMREGARPGGDRAPEGRRPPEGSREGQRPTPEQMKERFLQADKDGDKRLSKDEAPDRLKEGFDRVDSDDSGFIEEAELDALIRRLEQGTRGPREGQGRDPREGQGRGPREGERGDRERSDGDRERGEGRPPAKTE
jgi:hypothetical protein